MENQLTIQNQYSLVDMEKMSQAIAKSGLFGMKTVEQAMALMIVAQAEGRHPGRVATDYHIIQGRPTLKADTMLARFQEAGGSVKWLSYTNEKCEAEFAHPQAGSLKISWTIQDAQKANLTGKDVWRQYPRAMLRARVISEGIRTLFPTVLNGMYAPEEAIDFEKAAEQKEPRNVTPEPIKHQEKTKVVESEVVIEKPEPVKQTQETEIEKPKTIKPAGNGRSEKIRKIFELSTKLKQTPDEMKVVVGELIYPDQHKPIRESAEIPNEKFDDIIAYFEHLVLSQAA